MGIIMDIINYHGHYHEHYHEHYPEHYPEHYHNIKVCARRGQVYVKVVNSTRFIEETLQGKTVLNN